MKRPVLVTVISAVMIVVGLAHAVFGIVVMAKHNDLTFLGDSGLSSSQALAVGIASIVIGVLSVGFGFGLLRGSRVSRMLVALVEVAQIAFGIYAMVSLDSTQRPTGIGSIVGALAVLYLLFGTDKAKQFFAPH